MTRKDCSTSAHMMWLYPYYLQGKCTWAGTNGRRVTLQDTPLRALSEVERKVLCRVAVAKLQALNLGVHIRPPSGEWNLFLGSKFYTTSYTRNIIILKRKTNQFLTLDTSLLVNSKHFVALRIYHKENKKSLTLCKYKKNHAPPIKIL